ncbi:MAG: type IX secretion system plug protein domain-containing protein [bacterium]
MYKILLVIIVAFHLSLQAQDIEIKSLKTYRTGDATSYPVLIFNEDIESTVTIEFDIQADTEPNLSIVFRFCDKNWQPYDNIFLANQGYNTAYNLWYDKLPVTVRDAKYHFHGTFPNFDVTFPFSGKWSYFITDSFDTSYVYAEGRFVVVIPEVELRSSIRQERHQTMSLSAGSLERVFNITVALDLPDPLFPQFVDEVEIVENHKTDFPYFIGRESYGDLRYYEWDGNRKFSFTARDIPPGNEYRTADLRDKNRFVPPDVNAQYDGVETSRYYIPGKDDLNGGSKLSDFNDPNSEYMYVLFSLRQPEDFDSNIFISGSFNDWCASPYYKMYEDDGLYKITLELKRGIYDYQYVAADLFNNRISNIDWQILEGNFWETGNIYHIFLFYKEELLGGYDKIIGYKQIYSGDL